MGFFDFLIGKDKIERENIKFNEIDKWLENKINHDREKEEKLVFEVKLKIRDLKEKLKERVLVLEKINVDEKKVEEKIKIIVKENLNKYISELKKLDNNLEDLEDETDKKYDGYEKIIQKIDSVLISFQQKTRMNLEKATFIIGKEIEAVEDLINRFFRDLKKINLENKDFFEKLKIFFLLKKELNKVNENNNFIIEIEKNIKEYSSDLKNIEKEIERLESQSEKIKNSLEYKNEAEKIEEIKRKGDEIEKEIQDLRKIIDFKKLSGIFHADSKKMIIINCYREKFNENFKEDEGSKIIELMNEGNIESEELSERINAISEKKELFLAEKEFADNPKEFLKIKNLKNQIRIMEEKSENIKSEIENEKKRMKKFEENKKNILESIKKELEKINVNVI